MCVPPTDVTKCPPWEAPFTRHSKSGTFESPPHPSTLATKVIGSLLNTHATIVSCTVSQSEGEGVEMQPGCPKACVRVGVRGPEEM